MQEFNAHDWALLIHLVRVRSRLVWAVYRAVYRAVYTDVLRTCFGNHVASFSSPFIDRSMDRYRAIFKAHGICGLFSAMVMEDGLARRIGCGGKLLQQLDLAQLYRSLSGNLILVEPIDRTI
jgi:hypothetical protein